MILSVIFGGEQCLSVIIESICNWGLVVSDWSSETIVNTCWCWEIMVFNDWLIIGNNGKRNSNWLLEVTVTCERLLEVMVISYLLEVMVIGDWLIKVMVISDWLLDVIVISDWLLEVVVTCDRLLEMMVTCDWLFIRSDRWLDIRSDGDWSLEMMVIGYLQWWWLVISNDGDRLLEIMVIGDRLLDVMLNCHWS